MLVKDEHANIVKQSGHVGVIFTEGVGGGAVPLYNAGRDAGRETVLPELVMIEVAGECYVGEG